MKILLLYAAVMEFAFDVAERGMTKSFPSLGDVFENM